MKTTIQADGGRTFIVRPMTSGRVSLGMLAGLTGIGAQLTEAQCDAVIQALTAARAKAGEVAAHNARHFATYQPGA